MAETTETIHVLMGQVMAEIQPVAKSKLNQQQNYAFRGIDDAMAAVHDALIKYGVFFVPEVVASEYVTRTTKSGTEMQVVRLQVAYRFYGPGGDCIAAVGMGEAMDSGDKATQKAMSSALKYVLFHTFCIVTEETEHDDLDYSPPVGAGRQAYVKTKSISPAPKGKQVYSNVAKTEDVESSLLTEPGATAHPEYTKRDDVVMKNAMVYCPVCKGPMWDNRPKKATGEYSAKSPDWKCKDKSCDGVVWPKNEVLFPPQYEPDFVPDPENYIYEPGDEPF